MKTIQSILVPQISSLPEAEARARLALRWLVKQGVVEAAQTTCGLLGNGMAHAIAAGARRWPQADRLPFGQPVCGLQIVTRRGIYTPTDGFLEEAGCPQCRQEIGVPLFASLDEWVAAESDNFTCPECGFEDDINGFLYLQPCGFSNLAFIFNGWPAEAFSPAFLAAFGERLGFALRLVEAHAERH